MSIDFRKIEGCASRAADIEAFIQRLKQHKTFRIDTEGAGSAMSFGASSKAGDGLDLKDQIIEHLKGRLYLELTDIMRETSRIDNK